MSTAIRPQPLHALARVSWFATRRDRVRIPVWVVSLAGVIIISAASLKPMYPDRASLVNYVRIATGNPALQAFGGPGFGFDDPNIGVILVNETQLWGSVAMALMAVFLLVRHTRAEEDDERAEVIRSSVVGRHSPLAAAEAVVTAAVVLVAVVCAVGFVALGYPLAGSVSLAASFAAAGLLFVGVGAVAAQLANSARGALGYSTAVLGAMFIVRALGDAGRNWLRWLSPLGWVQSGRAYAHERWWPLVLCAVLAVGLVLLAHWLSTRRDLGSGLVAPRAGRPRAAASLLRAGGLELRMQRGAVAGWAVGMAVMGAVYGSIGEEIGSFLEDNPAYKEMMAQLRGVDLTDSFFATGLSMLAMFSCGFAISAALRLRTEEHAGRADAVLAGPLSRVRWAMGYVLVDVVGTVAIILAGGLGAGVGYAAVIGDAHQVTRLTVASLVTVPPVLVVMGIAVALFGLLPRAAFAAWGFLAGVFVVTFFGPLLRLPRWVLDLSPFGHVPGLPAVAMRWPPVLVMLGLAAALVAAGMWGLCRRDIHVT